jgi:hypothetical protein
MFTVSGAFGGSAMPPVRSPYLIALTIAATLALNRFEDIQSFGQRRIIVGLPMN